jgi:hypothetical protein
MLFGTSANVNRLAGAARSSIAGAVCAPASSSAGRPGPVVLVLVVAAAVAVAVVVGAAVLSEPCTVPSAVRLVVVVVIVVVVVVGVATVAAVVDEGLLAGTHGWVKVPLLSGIALAAGNGVDVLLGLMAWVSLKVKLRNLNGAR